jgi:hypothetical protein
VIIILAGILYSFNWSSVISFFSNQFQIILQVWQPFTTEKDSISRLPFSLLKCLLLAVMIIPLCRVWNIAAFVFKLLSILEFIGVSTFVISYIVEKLLENLTVIVTF